MMNIVKSMYISLAVALIMLGVPSSLAFASIVDYDDEPEEQEECEERSDYDHLCSGINGATGIPFCDQYNATQRATFYPNLTNPSHCLSREHNPIEFCEQFDDLTSTYEYCRNVPGSEEYFEYAKTGGPDESCLFDAYQIKCKAFPNMNETARAECPEGFSTNEDDHCVPLHREGCPEGYHSVDDDESGQCYPDDEGCNGWTEISGERFDMVLVESESNPDHLHCYDVSNYCPDHPDYGECKEYLEARAEQRAEQERINAEYNRNLNQTRTN